MPGHPSDSVAAPQFQRLTKFGPKIKRARVGDLNARKLIALLALVSAASCIAGGVELMLWPRGHHRLPPLDVLAHTPFETFLVPGILLACVVGGASLVCAALVWQRARAAIDATLLAGGALSVWMIAEIAIVRVFDAMSATFSALGLLLLGLGIREAWRAQLSRYRWWIIVTAFETCGVMTPAAIGIATANARIEGGVQAALVIAGGVVEGLLLGAGQACAFPLPVRKARYVAYTALGAAFAWASAMTVVALAAAPEIPTIVSALVGLAAGVLGVWAMGAAQWLELRHHTDQAKRWITWTALAWVLALPLDFAPGPFVDEQTPMSSQFALWGVGGLLMASVMALVTWQGVRRIADVPHVVRARNVRKR